MSTCLHYDTISTDDSWCVVTLSQPAQVSREVKSPPRDPRQSSPREVTSSPRDVTPSPGEVTSHKKSAESEVADDTMPASSGGGERLTPVQQQADEGYRVVKEDLSQVKPTKPMGSLISFWNKPKPVSLPRLSPLRGCIRHFSLTKEPLQVLALTDHQAQLDTYAFQQPTPF